MISSLIREALKARLIMLVIALALVGFGIRSTLKLSVDAFPDAALIYERNTALLREMGVAGWQALEINSRLPLRLHRDRFKAASLGRSRLSST